MPTSEANPAPPPKALTPNVFATPLRYPGGKGRLGPWLADLLRHNRVSGGWYVEPYAGGAGAAVMLLLRGYVNRIIINDADPLVFAFWWAILNDSVAFLQLLEETPVTIDSWYIQREIHAHPERHSLTEVGFATFFLNRTNRSGILSGGVIGGKTQNGPYLIDARFNKAELSTRIRALANMRSRIGVFGLDAMELLDQIEADLPSRCLVYFDPPYHEKGSQLYRNFYKPEDHERIATRIGRLKCPWIVTYDDCSPIRRLYKKYPCTEFSLHYSTHLERPKATEVMFYKNLNLHAPPQLRRA